MKEVYVIIKSTEYKENCYQSEALRSYDTIEQAQDALELLAKVFGSEIKQKAKDGIASSCIWNNYCEDGLSEYQIVSHMECTEDELEEMEPWYRDMIESEMI